MSDNSIERTLAQASIYGDNIISLPTRTIAVYRLRLDLSTPALAGSFKHEQAMSGDILLDIPTPLVGGLAFGSVGAGRAPPALSAPQTPDWTLPRPVEHAFRRGFALPLVASSRTSAREVRGASRAV